jgi:[ribosomal protein S5]-alanine N-acetyltransferase
VTRFASPDPPLADDRVALRAWTDDDLACIREASEDPRIPEGTTVPAAFTVEEGRAFVRRQWSRLDDGTGLSLAIVDRAGGDAVGAVVLMLRPQEGVAGIGYWLVPRARGRGLATAAVRLLSGWALGDAGLARVEAWVEPDNAPSLHVLERAGFEREGVLRSFLSFSGRRADAVVLSRIA